MIRLHSFTQGPETCHYLPDRMATLHYEQVASITDQEYQDKMNSGWRKFGPLLFQPVCTDCQECRPIRILADRFFPDRSQSRCLKRNDDLRVQFSEPVVDDERLLLLNRYHAAQTERKMWPENETEREDYFFRFIFNPVSSVEISVWDEDRLVAVAITDVTPDTVSGIYHFHDPDLHHRGLGTFVILQAISLAQHLKKRYAYFGYYVRECGSLSYKARYRPCELLGTDGVWREVPTDKS